MTDRGTSERGAVAVTVAIAALLIFGMAALAVDLGNAFARTKAVQAQADLSALAGGGSLPGAKSASDDAVKAVVTYLNHNQPQSDGQSCVQTSTCASASDLVDGNDSNGEIYYLSSTMIRVISPPARVQFGLAGALGFSSTAVQREATVGIFSPGPVVPFFIPADCASGSIDIKASNYNPNAPTFDPASSNGGTVARINSVVPLTVPGTTPTTLSVFGEKFTPNPALTVDFFHEGSGDRVPVDSGNAVPAALIDDNNPPRENDELKVELPAKVYNVPGTWYLRVNNGTGYSKDSIAFAVGNPTTPPVGCGVKSTGDFGVLESPRLNVTQLADAAALNMSDGLDHTPVPWSGTLPPRGDDSCNGYGTPTYPGAQLDNVSREGNNCVNILNGMNTDTVTRGMVDGGNTSEGSFKGRLDTPTLPGCDRNRGDSERTINSVAVNDDVLSCFLPTGVSVGDISTSSISAAHEGVLSSRIFDSPRFMAVPVIDTNVNPPNGYYPIKRFVPVFITDESPASTSASAGSFATSNNGVIVQSTKVVGLNVVVINEAALPETADANGDVVSYFGSGTKIIRLVD